MQVLLRSPLAPVALATRLKGIVPDTVTAATPAGVMGRGSEQSMTVWYYRPRFYNSFQTRLVASIDAEGSGSVIRGTIGAPRGSGMFMGCWMGFVLLFLAGATLLTIVLHAPLAMAGPLVGVPLAMALFGALLFRFGTRNGRSDRDAILAFLAETVDAR